MNNFIKKIIKRPKLFQRFTGITIPQFRNLSKRMLSLWKKAEKKRLSRNNRKRKIGGGRKYVLRTIDEKLFFILFYYRHYPTQEVLGFIFRLDQSSVSRLIYRIMPLIEKAADPELKNFLEKAKSERENNALLNWEKFIKKFPDLIHAITDATENRCLRPKNKKEQKKYYSGKKKAYTLKTQITVARSSKILDVSSTYPGSIHDKKIIDKEKTIDKIPKKTAQYLDLGYQGVSKDYPNHYIIIPPKKPKNGELSDLGKELKKIQSKRRVLVEHVFGKIKRYKICSDKYRGSRNQFNQIFRSIASIHNFTLGTF